MAEFWEEAFKHNHEMWGLNPTYSAILANALFVAHNVKDVLIPGIGYGRNGKIFADHGMTVTGIEISQTAIDLARKHYGNDMTLYHGSVTDMPFDDKQYSGIFCYALIHLLDQNERAKFIQDCYRQLADGGYMVFTTVTKEARIYRQGNLISKDRYEVFPGIKMFFYDQETIREEFGEAGLYEVSEVEESYPFYFLQCKKEKL